MGERIAGTLAELVDTDRYPLHLGDHPRVRALERRSRAALRAGSLFLLPGFLRPEGVERLSDEVARARDFAEYRRFERTPYNFKPPDESLPPTHPRRHREIYDLAYIYADRLRGTGLAAVYEWPPLTRYFSAVVGGELYPSADPKYSLLVSLIADGGRHGWHFDSNDFAVTLMLCPAEGGGRFEYVPALRSVDDERYDRVAGVLGGERSEVVSVEVEAGTLVLFHGHCSMHRVSPVRGARQRCMAIFSYACEPGLVFDHQRLRGTTLSPG